MHYLSNTFLFHFISLILFFHTSNDNGSVVCNSYNEFNLSNHIEFSDLSTDDNSVFFLNIEFETRNVQDDDFKIFPNPATSYIQIQNRYGDIQKIELYNILDQKICSKGLKNQKEIKINLEIKKD